MTKKQDLKSRVYKFYQENKDKGKHYVAAHFLAENVPKTTIYRHINNAAAGKPLARKTGTGRKPIFNTSSNRLKIKKMFDHQKKSSQKIQMQSYDNTKYSKKDEDTNFMLQAHIKTKQNTSSTFSGSSKVQTLIIKNLKTVNL